MTDMRATEILPTPWPKPAKPDPDDRALAEALEQIRQQVDRTERIRIYGRP